MQPRPLVAVVVGYDAAPIGPLGWKLPNAAGGALKSKKREREREKRPQCETTFLAP